MQKLRSLPLRLAPFLCVLAAVSACSLSLPALPGSCPAVPAPDTAHPPTVVGGLAVAPLAWQNAGATDAPTQESALAGADVFLADAAGNALPGLHATTSSKGTFDLRRIPADYGVEVVAEKREADGRPVTLRTITHTMAQGATANPSIGTTILTLALLQHRTGLIGVVNTASFNRAVALIYMHLAQGGPVNPADDKAMIALFTSWLATDAELKTLAAELMSEVSSPIGSYDELVAAIARFNGEVTPIGLKPLATPSPASPLPSATASASPDAGATASAPTGTPTPSGISGSGSPTPTATDNAATNAATPLPNLQGTVTTFAGGNGLSDVDGPLATAHFSTIKGLVLDAAGNIFVSEGTGRRVRKISTDGTVTTYAGSGVQGYSDGAGATAKFGDLAGISLGPDGSLFVIDTYNARIRKIDRNQVVSTFAGDGGQGHADGPGLTARFSNPTQLTFDATTGNLYVVEYDGQVIRQITPDGMVTTIAGTFAQKGYHDGNGDNALFFSPGQAAQDPNGQLFVTDSVNCVVRQVDLASHKVSTFVGTPPADGPSTAIPAGGYFEAKGSAAQFYRPSGIVYDPRGFIVVSDTNNNRVRKVLPDGTSSLIAGGTAGDTDGPAGTAQFTFPGPLAVGPGGVLYVVDGNGGTRIRKIQ
jgi:hypothetical protein